MLEGYKLKTWDVWLVGVLKDLAQNAGARAPYVHSLERARKLSEENKLQIPCIVYTVVNDEPMLELHGESGFYVATVELTMPGNDTNDIRTLSAAISTLAGEDFNSAYDPEKTNVEYIEVRSDVEQNELAAQLEEQGIKSSNMLLTVYRQTKRSVA